MKTALITGAAGFVGRSFLRHLSAEGWDIEVCDIAFPFPNSIDCRRFFAESEKRYDLVIHAAAVVGGRANIDGAPLEIAENLSIDTAALRWAVRTKPHHFVYFSSSAAYPVYLQNAKAKESASIDPSRLRESDIDLKLPELPDAIYGWAKLTGERLCAVAATEGVRCHIFRPFSGTGEGQAADYPVPAICRRILSQQDPLTLWSDTTRDFIHVDDVINAVMRAVENDLPGPYNLCTGTPTSFRQVAQIAAGIRGYSPKIEVLSDMPKGVPYRVGDPALLHSFYQPQVDLKEIIGRVLEWERRNSSWKSANGLVGA